MDVIYVDVIYVDAVGFLSMEQKKEAPYCGKLKLTPSRPVREGRIAAAMASSLTATAIAIAVAGGVMVRVLGVAGSPL